MGLVQLTHPPCQLTIYIATIFIALVFSADALANRNQERCSEQENLNHCVDFLTERYTNYSPLEELGACCNQLWELESNCVCEGLKMALGQDFTRAKDLPFLCRLKDIRCHFGSRGSF
ncbi:2S seed storage albumin protein-like [Mercurialis annua]|uniref:2S seed storage albumin protein-like n=1 Tax=Mercurialis annua TaxID=3986 RepID=UPI00215DED78|nr:2S seed storage albumin protein-like [Mercurialis annua]